MSCHFLKQFKKKYKKLKIYSLDLTPYQESICNDIHNGFRTIFNLDCKNNIDYSSELGYNLCGISDKKLKKGHYVYFYNKNLNS